MFISHCVIDGYTKEKKQTKKTRRQKKGSKYHRSRIDIAQQFLQLVQKSSWRKFTLKELVFHPIKVPIGYSHWGQVSIPNHCLLQLVELI